MAVSLETMDATVADASERLTAKKKVGAAGTWGFSPGYDVYGLQPIQTPHNFTGVKCEHAS